MTSPEPEPAQVAFAQGDYRRLRAEQARGAQLTDAQRAALRVDPVHAAVLALCALGLLAIALRYFGAE